MAAVAHHLQRNNKQSRRPILRRPPHRRPLDVRGANRPAVEDVVHDADGDGPQAQDRGSAAKHSVRSAHPKAHLQVELPATDLLVVGAERDVHVLHQCARTTRQPQVLPPQKNDLGSITVRARLPAASMLHVQLRASGSVSWGSRHSFSVSGMSDASVVIGDLSPQTTRCEHR